MELFFDFPVSASQPPRTVRLSTFVQTNQYVIDDFDASVSRATVQVQEEFLFVQLEPSEQMEYFNSLL